ncbi:DNA translocase FtsK [Paraferrimonas sp. SM1919]|uniref:DNA translocase FtsK n=1 Tax=Paraferrimonas sp. SM1919 TaxID=2662263 RepID=UPI0013D0256D
MTGIDRLLEGGLIFSAILATILLIALSTFDMGDPSWSQSGTNDAIENVVGIVGSYSADILFFSFGYSAYLFPFMIMGCGWLIFKQHHKFIEVDYFSVGLRLLGFVLMILGLSALASMNMDLLYVFSAGGFVGDLIVISLLPYFNSLGTTLVLLFFVGAGFTLLTGISWIAVADFIGKLTINLVKICVKLPLKIRNWYQLQQQRKQQQLAEQQTQQAKAVLAEPELQAIAPQSSQVKESKLTIHTETLDDEFSIDFDNIDDNEENFSFDSELTPEPTMSPNDMDSQSPELTQAKVVDGIIVLPEKPKPEPITLPDISLLDVPNRSENPISREELEAVARLVEAKLADFKIIATVVDVFPGPVITRFELDLAPGVKVSKISSLAVDLARALSTSRVRIVENIPGKSVIGLELPNKFRETVFMRDVLDSKAFAESKSHLSMVLGADIAGNPVVVDLGKMPHLLVAGTTGSGKSVGVNVMIVSLLYKSSPEDVRFIMIDPKMLELSVYEGIPHLLTEVVTDMKQAANSLRWCVGEMERRYQLMAALGVRNIAGYNAKVKKAAEKGEPIWDPLWDPNVNFGSHPPALEKLPSIVVVIDEFADMMMIVGKKVEELIARIAQKARAAGIHLILATQRPSVDVITGLIKANVPTRMAFQVSSKIDSRTILDQQGAETLLGMGDMLYMPPGSSQPERVHGAFVDDHEVHRVVADWKSRGEPQYIDEILQGGADGEQVLLPGEQSEAEEELDALYDQAVEFVTQTRKGSISSVQRKFKIGYNRAARIIESMEAQGVVSPPGHNGNREVLAPPPVREQ